MRSGGVALDTCLAKVQGGLAELSQRLRRTREASPCPVEVPSWVHKSAGDANGNPQSKELSLEMKNDLNEANLVLHNGEKTRPYLKESLRRNSASLAAQSKTVDLFLAPIEEHLAEVSRSVGQAPVRDWLGGGPRAADSCREQYRKGEPRGSGPPRRQKPQMGVSEEHAPSVFLEGLASELELASLCPVLSVLLHTHPEVLSNDETRCVFLGHSKPMFSEQIVEYKKMLSTVKSTSNDLQITPGLLAPQAFEVATPLCHS